MFNLALLDQPFPASETPGLDTLDPRFQEIASLVEASDFPKVGSQAEGLFNDNIFDIRIIGYYLYAVLLEQGLRSVASMMAVWCRTMQENWAAVGPGSKKEKHAQRSLTWFFEQSLQSLQYRSEKRDPVWEQWQKEMSREEVNGIVQSCDAFRKALVAAIGESPHQEQISKLVSWLKDFEQTLPAPEIAEEVPNEEQSAAGGGSNQQAGNTSTSGQPMGVSIEASYPLQLLMKKIDAFEQLVQRGDFSKAAIVADDINTIIANFDPRIYFPQTLAKYYRQLSTSIEAIAPCWEAKESITWQVTAQFYQVDLDGFVQG